MKQKNFECLVYIIILMIAIIVQWFMSGVFFDNFNKMGWTRNEIFYFLAGQSILYGSAFIVYRYIRNDDETKTVEA